MNYKVLFFASIGLLLHSFSTTAQPPDYSRSPTYVDMTMGIGNQFNVSLSYQYIGQRDISKKVRKNPIIMELGIGFRFSSFAGRDVYFTSILDQDKDPKHIDSVLVSSPQMNSLNLKISIGFCLKDRWHLVLNIDGIGFSFGGRRSGSYINGSITQPVTITPAVFNYLGTSSKSGTLNAEMYLAYKISSKWLIKFGYQAFVFEYVTDTEVQQYPNPNDRFDYLLKQFTGGIIYKIN